VNDHSRADDPPTVPAGDPTIIHCPLCRQRLPEPGMAIDPSWPLILPPADAVRAVTVRVTDERIEVDLANGAKISVPMAWSWRLAQATPEQRADYRIIEGGLAINWPQVDEDIGVAQLLGVPEDLASAALGYGLPDKGDSGSMNR